MLFAVAVDRMVLAEIVLGRSWDAIAPALLLIGASQSMLVLVVIGRPRTVKTSSSMPYGWTFGLGLGSMQAAYIIVRIFDPATWDGSTGFGVLAILMGVIVSSTCALGSATISGWQGGSLLFGRRVSVTIASSVLRAMMIASVVLSVFQPLSIVLATPPAFYFAFNIAPKWALETLSEPSKKEYRRAIRRDALTKKQN